MSKILVVEDEKNIRNNIAELLEESGFEIITAENGEHALSALELETPDLIISDILMPQLDGIKLYQQLRNIERLKSVPFIFLTAKADLADIREGLNLGVDDYITKPFNFKDLLHVVDIRLKKRREILAEAKEKYAKETWGEPSTTKNELNQQLGKLSKSEMKVVIELSKNLNSYEIANKLFLSFKTVQNHRANIVKKLGLSGQNSLLSFSVTCRNFGLLPV